MKTKKIITAASLVLALGLIGAISWLPGCDRSTDGGVFKSTDGGSNWEQKVVIDEENSLSKADVMSMAINPIDSEVIYIGVSGEGIYKTIDAGGTWRRVLPSEVDIFAIAIDPQDPNIVYASSLDGNNGKIFKSPNGFEETVEEILVEAQGGLALVDIIVDHYDDNVIYAMSEEGGIFKSTDAGATWSANYWFDGNLTAITMSPTDSRVLYVGTDGEGVLKTTDGGENWTEIVDAFAEIKGADEIMDIVSVSSDTVYGATSYGLIRTNDGGSTWEVVSSLLEPGEVAVETLVIPPQSPNIIYFANGSALHKSTNSGQTWSNWLLPTSRIISALAIDPTNLDIVYAGVEKPKD